MTLLKPVHFRRVQAISLPEELHEFTVLPGPYGTSATFRLNEGSQDSDCGVLASRRVHRVKLAIALLDAPGPLMSGNGDADMVRANAFACGSNFLLCLAGCQRKDLVTETWLVAIAASWFHRCRTPAPAWLCWSRRFRRGRPLAGRRSARLRALAVAREHSLGRFELTKLTGELLALRIDARQRLADPLFLFPNLVQRRHSVPPRQSKA